MKNSTSNPNPDLVRLHAVHVEAMQKHLRIMKAEGPYKCSQEQRDSMMAMIDAKDNLMKAERSNHEAVTEANDTLQTNYRKLQENYGKLLAIAHAHGLEDETAEFTPESIKLKLRQKAIDRKRWN